MGQRTQMVVEVTICEHDYKKNKDVEKVYLGSYHNQWGIGKMQLFDVMRFLTTYINGCDEYKLPDTLYKGWLIPKDQAPFKGEATPDNVIKWLNTRDNNDGGVLLKVKMDKYGYFESGELYIFNDPEMESAVLYKQNPQRPDSDYISEVNRVVSFVEYMSYTPEYFSGEENEAFINAFTSLLRFCKIKIMQPAKEN